MDLFFNLFVVGLVLLIGYWWANQGLLSALLHLGCVVVAGAIALAVWEPLTMAVLTGGWFDNYAWGVILLGCFAVTLAVTRVISDRIVKGNVFLPNWANMTFGFICGAIAGIITVGILVLGAGFFQTADSMLYPGWGRDRDAREIIERKPKPWLPVARWTVDFYEYTSLGSLYPNISSTPLASQNPDLDRQASLVRDSYDGGKGQLSLAPDGAKVVDVFELQSDTAGGPMNFNDPAMQSLMQDLIQRLRSSGAKRSDIAMLEAIQSNPQNAPAIISQLSPQALAQLGQMMGASSNQRFLGNPMGSQSSLLVVMSFNSKAIDYGEQLTLSQAQVRLICHDSDKGGHAAAEVLFPYGWGQSIQGLPFSSFIFDSQTYYVTSVPGREAANVMFSFILPNNLTPEFVQVRGTRYSLAKFKDRQTGRFPAVTSFALATKIRDTFQPQAPTPMIGGPPQE